MVDTVQQLSNLSLSAQEVSNMNPGWDIRMIEDYLTLSRDLTLLANTNDINEEQVVINTQNIASNAAAISINSANISNNTGNISSNSSGILNNAANLNAHINLDSAHGVNGNNVGTLNFCTTGTGGVVLLSQLVNNAAFSPVQTTNPNATNAPATYNQAQIQSIVVLANELKSDMNTLVSNFNALVNIFNDLLAKQKTAQQMDNI